MSVILQSSAGGQITLQEPTTASNFTQTLPAATGSVALLDGSNNFSVAGNLSFNSGFGSAGVAYGCRAWVNFNGTGTVAIRGSGNVSSITDNDTGSYTVNFTTAMPDVNFSAIGSQSDDSMASAGVEVTPATTTTVGVKTKNFSNNTRADALKVSIAVFR